MKIYIHQNGKNLGPFSLEELQNSVIKRKFKEDDLACHDGKNWIKLHEVPGLELPKENDSEESTLNSDNLPVKTPNLAEKNDKEIAKDFTEKSDQVVNKTKSILQKSKDKLKFISENIDAKELKEKAAKTASNISSSEKIQDLKAKAQGSVDSIKSGSLTENLKAKAQETAKRVKSGEIVQDIKDKTQDFNKKLTNSIIYVILDGQKSGPYNPIEINKMISDGKIGLDDKGFTNDSDTGGIPLKDSYFSEMGVGEDVVSEYEIPELPKVEKNVKLPSPRVVRIVSTVLGSGILIATFLTWYINEATVSGYSGKQSMSASGQLEYIGLLTLPGFLTFLSAVSLLVSIWISKLNRYSVFPLVACVLFSFMGLVYEPSGASSTSQSSGGLVGGSANVYWLKGIGITTSLIFSIFSGLFRMYSIFGNILKVLGYPLIVYERLYYPIFKRCISFNPFMCLGLNIFLSIALFLLFSLFNVGIFSFSITFKMLLFFTTICIFRSSLLALLVKFKSKLNYVQSIKKCFVIDMLSIFIVIGVMQTPKVTVIEKTFLTLEEMDEVWKEYRPKDRVEAFSKLLNSSNQRTPEEMSKDYPEEKLFMGAELSKFSKFELADEYISGGATDHLLEDREVFEKVLEIKAEIKEGKIISEEDFKLIDSAAYGYIPRFYRSDRYESGFDMNLYRNRMESSKESTIDEMLEILNLYHEGADEDLEYGTILKEMRDKRQTVRDLGGSPFIFLALMVFSLLNTHSGLSMLIKRRPLWLFAYTLMIQITSLFILIQVLQEWH